MLAAEPASFLAHSSAVHRSETEHAMASAPHASLVPPEERSRVRMKPEAPASGVVDGAWWPRSNALAEQLPELLTELWTASAAWNASPTTWVRGPAPPGGSAYPATSCASGASGRRTQ